MDRANPTFKQVKHSLEVPNKLRKLIAKRRSQILEKKNTDRPQFKGILK